ncbi:hypothetical protein PTKU15_69860 [Paraburkholderia terrae]|nr:hypothetical protein PTKU15_69860 [Paraburkholderia terrae]
MPGGGPMARLPRLMGRGRALEILLSGNDINGDLAERYGYVNRSLPDAQLGPFVDTLARRIASFDKQSLAACAGTSDVAFRTCASSVWKKGNDESLRAQARNNQ